MSMKFTPMKDDAEQALPYPHEVDTERDVTASEEEDVLTPMERPELGRRLTTISQKYDRGNKGYLDDTELALRRMDSKNQGFLDIDKVYMIMETLRQEQAQSAELIDAIRKESKKAMNLKRGVIALSCFAVLLAVANIGTSFAAATLAKDMKVVSGDLTTMGGARLGTTSKIPAFSMQPVEPSQRRHLEKKLCSSTTNTCNINGVLPWNTARDMYKMLCDGWPNANNRCTGGGVPLLWIECNGYKTSVLGGNFLPAAGPKNSDDWAYTVFPTTFGNNNPAQNYKMHQDQTDTCTAKMLTQIYCPTYPTGADCFVVSEITDYCYVNGTELEVGLCSGGVESLGA